MQGWYGTCCVGSRTVGCCSHVTAILWHLGVGQAIIDTTYYPLAASRLLNDVCDSITYTDINDGSGEDNDVIYTLKTYDSSSDDASTSVSS